MSKFSGKCDLYDCLIDIGRYTEEDLKNNVKIYVGDSTEPLIIESAKDLIPYYPYIIGMSHTDKNERKTIIHLSSQSYVDREEQDLLCGYKSFLMKIYRRCKRKKEEFDTEKAAQQIVFWNHNLEQITELARRIKEQGEKANIEGIHLKMHELYRQWLVDEMIENGLNPADYGYERFCRRDE